MTAKCSIGLGRLSLRPPSLLAVTAPQGKFMFKVGDQITVTVRPVKNRKYVGPIDGVVLADGKVLNFHNNTNTGNNGNKNAGN